MFGTQHFTLFVVSGLMLNVTPGQDTFYIVGRSVSQGRRAGVLSVLGVVSGCAVHTLAAAFGLSALLATSAHAFTAVKIAGAAYLVYLGITMLIERTEAVGASVAFGHEGSWAIFRAGVLSNLLNPATALFFMAFLPQFVDPNADSRILTFLFLGAVFIFNGTLWCLFLVWCASGISSRLRRQPSSGAIIKRATGALFVGLGLKLAVST